MYRAWNEEFYATVKSRYPDEYGKMSYKAAFQQWRNSFYAEWPSLLDEPDSEKLKGEDVVLKAIIAVVEVLLPEVPPSVKAQVISWMVDNLNERKRLFASPMELDYDEIASFEPPNPLQEQSPAPPESARDSAPTRKRRARERLDGLDVEVRRKAQAGLHLVTGQAVGDDEVL